MRLSLRNKLILEILPLIIGIVISSAGFVIYKTNNREKELANQQMIEMARGYANQIDVELRSFQSAGASVAEILGSTSGTNREDISSILQHYLASNPALETAFVVYEPNAFDNQDQQFANQAGYDSTGRFVVNWDKLKNHGDVTREAISGYQKADYYLVAKNLQQNAAMEPSITDGQLIVRFVSPIKKKGEFIGEFGMDASPTGLDQIISNIKVFQSGYAFLVSKNGTFISIKDKNLVGNKTLIDLAKEKKNSDLTLIAQKIKIGSENHVETTDPFSGKAVTMFFAPVNTTGWGFVIAAPQDEMLSETIMLRNTLIVMATFAVIFLMIYIWIIARSISRPITALSEVANKVSSGDLDVEIHIHSKDEIGQTADGFRRMIAYLQTMAKAAQRISERDLSEVVTPQSAHDVLGNAFVKMIAGLRQTTGQIAASADQVHSASSGLAVAASQSGQATSQITATVQQVALGTAQQSNSVSRTADSVVILSHAIAAVTQGAHQQTAAIDRAAQLTSQISSSLQDVASAAQTVTQNSELAARSAQEGAQKVQQTLQGMLYIQQKVGLAAQKVQEMGKRSGQIGEIVETIGEIAGQTNLLAINAAIETAHAQTQASILTETILNRQMVTQAQLLNQILSDRTRTFTPAFWVELAHNAHLDGISITDRDGVVVYSNDPKIIGFRFPEDPKEQASVFRKLIQSRDGVVCQKTQLRSIDKKVFKYVGVSRQDEPGIVEVGFQGDTLADYEMKLGGFAVIAGEVRKLAEKSAEATKQIAAMAKDIEISASSAVSAMVEGAHEVETGTQLASSSGDALQSILNTVETVLDRAHQSTQAVQSIAASAAQLVQVMDEVSFVVEANTHATQQMKENSQEVSQAMENIASISEENSAAVEEVSASTEEMNAQVEDVAASAQTLAELAQSLQRIVAQFTISDVAENHEYRQPSPASVMNPVAVPLRSF